MDIEQTGEPLTIVAAGDAWAAAQRARRKPLAEPTIASYCDAWRSFSTWAATHEKRAVAEIGVTDLARGANIRASGARSGRRARR